MSKVYHILSFIAVLMCFVYNIDGLCTSMATKPTAQVKKYEFKSCIIAEFALYVNLNQGQYLELNNGTVNINSSRCENGTAPNQVDPMLVIDFECATLSLTISHTNDSRTFVKAIAGEYHFNSTNTTFTNTTGLFYTSQSGHYYKCKSEQPIVVKQNPEASLVLSNFAYEAFRNTQGKDFYQIPEECPLDSMPVSDLVRIGVGVCLVALVAIVLVAYFIGRRRWSERSSYESV